MKIHMQFQTSANPKPKPISNEIKPIKSQTYQLASCLVATIFFFKFTFRKWKSFVF